MSGEPDLLARSTAAWVAGWRPSTKRGGCKRDPDYGPGNCVFWWEGCPRAEWRGCYQLWAKQADEAAGR